MCSSDLSVVVGKLSRAESALDPAPISMFETVVSYVPEYKLDRFGRRATFVYDEAAGTFLRDERGALVPDEDGRPFRQWREHIKSPDDIWVALWGTTKGMVELLRRTGPSLTRSKFVATMESTTGMDTKLGPILTWSPTDHFGADQVHVLEAVCTGAGGQYTTPTTFLKY